MKFNAAPKVEIGATRIIKRFALFPIDIHPITVWLETCYIEQKRYEGMGGEEVYISDYWANEKFVSKGAFLSQRLVE